MRARAQKQKSWSKELLERASEFHGHGGPFMVVGLRMGLEEARRQRLVRRPMPRGAELEAS